MPQVSIERAVQMALERQRADRLADVESVYRQILGQSPGTPTAFSQPRWDGGDLRGRTILLHSEQNVSDTIQFVRYVPLVTGRGGRIVVACQNELVRLLANNPHLGRICLIEQPLPPFDVYCPLMSLPLMFGTTQFSIPAYTPYLASSESLSQSWAQRLGPRGIRKRIGVVYAAGNDSINSIPPDQLAPLLSIDGIEFHSLQKNGSVIGLTDHSNDLSDFAEIAAIIANLDLVICVDGPIAHIAGALDKPVWLLLDETPDGRWTMDRPDNPWYPTMRIFCRDKTGGWAGDWKDVIRHTAAQIKKIMAQQ